MLPTSDAIFAVQNEAPKTPEGWEAIENDAIAIAETARSLITIRGRMCSSGLPVPSERADFIKFAQGMVDAAQVTYKAAQTKNQEMVSDATGVLSDACESCHTVYREVPVRCTVK
jgi:cytochrome c556